jgi:hypothetical protein
MPAVAPRPQELQGQLDTLDRATARGCFSEKISTRIIDDDMLISPAH